MMKIKCFCRHKTAGWDGVIYVKEDGRTWVSSGYGFWEVTPAREASLEMVDSIDTVQFCGRLRECPDFIEGESLNRLLDLLAG